MDDNYYHPWKLGTATGDPAVVQWTGFANAKTSTMPSSYWSYPFSITNSVANFPTEKRSYRRVSKHAEARQQRAADRRKKRNHR